MATPDNGHLTETILSLEGGVDGGFASPLLLPNQTAWGVNTTHRGGWPTCRPGFIHRTMDFQGDAALQYAATEGRFQGAGSYISDNGSAYIAYAVSGRVFLVNIAARFKVKEITIPGMPDMANRPHAWFQQAENWLIKQDGISPPFLYNGSTARRAGDHEVPVGGPMAYGKGRLWVARRSLFFGGDLVGSHPELGRDSVLRFEENEFLNEGGAFAVERGPITGMIFGANLDTGLSESDLFVSTADNVHAFNAPVDRDVWKDLQYPILRYAARDFGASNHESMVVMNGDVLYRSTDGVRSLAYARRDFDAWGNSPISRQVARALQFDTEERLYAASAINFDNRMLMTIQPQRHRSAGIYHRGLVVLDYHLITGMGRKVAPAWEGVWTGINILQVVTVRHGREHRAFILGLGCDNQIQLWELSKARPFDYDGTADVPIQWTVESRGMTWNRPTRRKRLLSANQWLDKILGPVSSRAVYRGDDSPTWQGWGSWSDCVDYTNCGKLETCASDPDVQFQPVTNYRDQQRPRIGLSIPTMVPDQQTGGFTSDGYWFQLRFENVGKFRLKILEVLARESGDTPFGDMRNTACDAANQGECAEEECQGIESCDRDDYGYSIVGPCLVNSDDYPYPYPYPGPEPEPEPEPGDELPIWDPDNPTVEPTPDDPCPEGTSAGVEVSFYAWSLNPGENPNTLLTSEQIAMAKCLLASQLGASGSTAASAYKWVNYSTGGSFYAAIRKTTCDAFDGIDDWVFVGSTATALAVAVCVPD